MADKTLSSLTAATPATGGLIYGTQGGADRKFTLTAAGAAVVEAEDLAVTVSELNYSAGVTSPIQEQFANVGDGIASVNSTISTLTSIVDGKQDSEYLGEDVAAAIHACTAKTTLSNGDEMLLCDSTASYGRKKSTWSNIVANLAGSFSNLAHASRHKSSGADAIKLDELDAPTDVTTLNATTSAHGLLPKLGGGTTDFLRADGTWAEPAGGGGSASTDNQLFTIDGTWTNPSPSTAKRMLVRLVGGGGGGGSGRRGAAGTVRCGGGGGASGCFVEYWALTTDFSSSVSVSVGAGGTGGAAQTADDSNGNSGGTGGSTVFGDSTAKGGGGGSGGTASSGPGGGAVSNGNYYGSTTSNACTGAAASTAGGAGNGGTAGIGLAPASGASGAGITSADAVSNGGAGGTSGNANIGLVVGGSAGSVAGTLSGGDGVSTRGGGTGGGGGASSKTTDAGNGGAGGGYGSGGGGGGASLTGVGSSGAGGDGGNGYAIIITFL